MASINPYRNFAGNTEEAFNFYKSVFGGEFLAVMRFKDMGEAAGPIPEGDSNKIMHIALPIGSNVLMGTDALESLGQKLNMGNNYYISIDADTRDQADKFFNELSAGGKVEMPMADMFWGDYYGSFFDKFGLGWMVSYNAKKA